MTAILQKRRQKLGEQLTDNSLFILLSGDAPVTSGDQNYDYTPHRNFYYLTGISRPKMALVMRKLEGIVEEFLFIEVVSELEEKWSGFRMRLPAASEVSGIEKVLPDTQMRTLLGGWLLNEGFENAYFDLSRTSYKHEDTAQHEFAQELFSKYPFLQIKNAYPFITAQRLIKSEDEINDMRTAIAKTKSGIEALMKNSKPGMMEYQLEAHYDFAIKQLGVKKPAFQTIAAGGANATVLHYHDNDQPLNDGELVLFDLGAQWNNYCADISRTFPVNGKFSPRQKEVYEAVLEVQVACIEKIRPGLEMAELNLFAKESLAKVCQRLGLIQDEAEVINYYYHSIGHYLGLDTHDVGGRGGILKPGMVITIEPGLYIAEESIGIRIEDDILVTETGYENLSADIIKTVADIERFMMDSN